MSTVKLHYNIDANDFQAAGEASSNVKKKLSQLGVNSAAIKRVAVSMYEAEINAVIHANGGTADVEIDADKVVVEIKDVGPGIPDIAMAMQEGFSTATDKIREMGFGAGMGLPNIKRHADEMFVESVVGKGTTVIIKVYF